MITKLKTNILWFSDIHLRDAYFDETYQGTSGKIISALVTKMVDALQSEKVDIILISGDLAFSGNNKQYECFHREFILPLTCAYPDIPIYTIPGNHDVMYNNTDAYRNYNIKDIYDDRCNKLKNKTTEFELFFDHYKKYTSQKINLPDDSSDLKISKEYRDKRLFGHIVDHKNKLILILLNSAWFSLGTEFNKIIAENDFQAQQSILSSGEYTSQNPNDFSDFNPNLKSIRHLVYHAIATRYKFEEYGKQIIGESLLDEELFKDLIRYNDYFVVTALHHGLNWLDWNELYNYDPKRVPKLRQIINKSDLVLCSHQHLPIQVRENKISENTYHLDSGVFTEDDIYFDSGNPLKGIEYSRFSLLKIEKELDYKIIDKRFKLEFERDEKSVTQFDFAWDNKEDYNIYINKCARLKIINDENTLESFKNAFLGFDISKYFGRIFTKEQNYYFRVAADKKLLEIVFFVQDKNLFKDFENQVRKGLSKQNIDYLSPYSFILNKIDEHGIIAANVYFLTCDIFYHQSNYKLYDNQSLRQSFVKFTEIRVQADKEFNEFRKNIFGQFEKIDKNNIKQEISVIMQAGFILDFLPYWKAEEYMDLNKSRILK